MIRFLYITTAIVLSLSAVHTEYLDINNVQPVKVCTICYHDQTLKGDDFCQSMEKNAKQIVYVGQDDNLLAECLAFQRDFMEDCCEEPITIEGEADYVLGIRPNAYDHGGRSEPTSQPTSDEDVEETSDGTSAMESSYWSRSAMLSVIPVLFF